jgi:cob(I)alamin adenosyltransferase
MERQFMMPPLESQRQDKAPRAHQDLKASIRKGLIIVHTGNGKGKSTAAFGTALRAMGRGYRVAIVQFIKGKWKTGESLFFVKFPEQCDVFTLGDGFTWITRDFEKDAQSALAAWKKCCEVLHDEKYDLVIFDEINYAMKYNFLDAREIVKGLEGRPAGKHVILTGNGAPEELINAADLVTEMKAVKHPYQKGIKAQPGIEY